MDIIAAGGVMAWIDLGLRLIHRWISPAIMMATARRKAFPQSTVLKHATFRFFLHQWNWVRDKSCRVYVFFSSDGFLVQNRVHLFGTQQSASV
jgi:hypothetical protein